MMDNTFILLAAIFGFTGVALGAFGAHSLRARFEAQPGTETLFRTAVQYQMYHVAALIGVAWARNTFESDLIAVAGWLFAVGIVIFSGSLYLLSLSEKRWLGALTPIGGVAFLGGWLLLGVGVL